MKKILRFLCVAALGLIMVTGLEAGAEAKNPTTILNGIYLGDIDISGMSVQQAQAAGNAYVEALGQSMVLLQNEEGQSVEVPASEFGLSWANPQVVEEALSLGTSGNIVARYKEKKDIENGGYICNMELAVDRERIHQIVEENCSDFGKQAIEPTLERVDDKFVIKEGQAGLVVDKEATANAITEALANAKSDETIVVNLVTMVQDPSNREEELAKVTDLIGTFTTSFKSSNASRSGNVTNGASLINGTVLFPGEEFSTYEAVKPFTAENGYFMAGSYLNGMVVDSMGGGICQVSTTLYNAVLRAELEITERHSHSMVVAYVQISGDAAIAESSGKDFTFKNNYDFPIYIEGFTTSSKNITFNIYGVETRPDNRTIEFENEIIETITPDYERIIPDAGQGVGYVSVQSAHIGYKAKLWKVIKENGEVVSREQVNSSSYSASPRTATVGTATANPQRQAEIMAAIGTANIDHVRGVAAMLLEQERAEAALAQ